MKILAFILAVYLLGLSVLPCVDKDFFTTDNQEMVMSSPSHQDTSHAEACQPLCSCSCCGTHTIVTPYTLNVAPELIPHSPFLIRATSFISFDGIDIWQPPKLS